MIVRVPVSLKEDEESNKTMFVLIAESQSEKNTKKILEGAKAMADTIVRGSSRAFREALMKELQRVEDWYSDGNPDSPYPDDLIQARKQFTVHQDKEEKA